MRRWAMRICGRNAGLYIGYEGASAVAYIAYASSAAAPCAHTATPLILTYADVC